MTVAIVKSSYANVRSGLERAIELVGYKPKKETIVLKPCAGFPDGSIKLGDCVPPEFLEALAGIFKDKEVIIAEGVAAGMDYQKMIRNFRYDRIPRKFPNVRLVNLEKSERIPVKWKRGEIKLPKLLFDNEYINVAKMKTHYFTHVSLCMKNQKGTLQEFDKQKFHMKDLQADIFELSQVLKPDLNIIDGIVAMDGNGPYSLWHFGGRARKLGLLFCGQDIHEVDNVAVQVMQLDRKKTHVPDVPTKIVGEKLSDVSVAFKPPNFGDQLNFGHFHLQALSGCSGCMQTFLMSTKLSTDWHYAYDTLRGTVNFLHHGVLRPFYIFFGPRCSFPAGVDPKKAKMVCFGDCTRGLAKKNGLPHIPGCPPPAAEMRKMNLSHRKLQSLIPKKS